MLAHIISAGNQNRTDITDLEGRCNNHYTIPASFTSWWDGFKVFHLFVGKVGNDPTILGLTNRRCTILASNQYVGVTGIEPAFSLTNYP